MKAWAIFVHSIRQVFGNLPEALQISGLIYLAQMAIAIALGVTTTAMEATTEPTGAEATKVTIAMMATLIALTRIAVAWHRFVLLNERPAGYLPQLSLQRLGRYAGRSVLIALLSLLIGMVLWLAFGTLFVGLFGLTWLTELLIVICVIVPISWRWSPK